MSHHHHRSHHTRSHHTHGCLGFIEGILGIVAILVCISVFTTPIPHNAHKARAAAERPVVVAAHKRSHPICQPGWWADGDAYQHGQRLTFHWNHMHDRRVARADGGRVVFDGTALQNRSDARVRFVHGKCEH